MRQPRDAWLVAREALRAEAPGALARGALLGAWRVPADRAPLLAERARDLPRAAAAGWDRDDLKGGTDTARAPWEHALLVADRAGDGPVAPAAWARLAALGDRIDAVERRAWGAARYPADPTADADALALWRALAAGDALADRERLDRRWRAPLLAVCAAVIEDLGADPALREDLVELVTRRLTLADPSGWPGLAARVLETAGPTPAIAVARALDDAGRALLAGCAARHGVLAGTVAALWPESVEPAARAAHLAAELAEPDAIEALLDVHVALRVLDAWADGADDAATWRVVRQNRGRVRGRLRAVAAQHPERLLRAIHAMDAPAARAEAALRRHAWGLAQRALTQDPGAPLEPFVPPCDARPAGLDLDAHAIRTWVLLVILRGHGARLRRWVRTGGTGDRDSGWARLLTEALPDALVDPDRRARRGYHRLRAWLDLSLDAVEAELRPRLAAIAAAAPHRIDALLAADWHPDVPRPRARLGALALHARDWLREWQDGR